MALAKAEAKERKALQAAASRQQREKSSSSSSSGRSGGTSGGSSSNSSSSRQQQHDGGPSSSAPKKTTTVATVEERSRAAISAARAQSAKTGQSAAERAVAGKSARHAEAFFTKWANSRTQEFEEEDDADDGRDDNHNAAAGGGGGGGGGKKGAGGTGAGGGGGVSEWSDGGRVATLVLGLFGAEEPAAVRLKHWKCGPLRVQKVARVVAARAVLDESSPPDLPMQVEV
jgi:hypothetical protein